MLSVRCLVQPSLPACLTVVICPEIRSADSLPGLGRGCLVRGDPAAIPWGGDGHPEKRHPWVLSWGAPRSRFSLRPPPLKLGCSLWADSTLAMVLDLDYMAFDGINLVLKDTRKGKKESGLFILVSAAITRKKYKFAIIYRFVHFYSFPCTFLLPFPCLFPY